MMIKIAGLLTVLATSMSSCAMDPCVEFQYFFDIEHVSNSKVTVYRTESYYSNSESYTIESGSLDKTDKPLVDNESSDFWVMGCGFLMSKISDRPTTYSKDIWKALAFKTISEDEKKPLNMRKATILERQQILKAVREGKMYTSEPYSDHELETILEK